MMSTNNILSVVKKGFVLASFLFTSLSSSYAFADLSAPDIKKGELTQTTAHIDVKLGMLSNKKADVILKIPAHQAYGFTGKATTPEQNAAVDSVVDNLKQNIANIIVVEPALQCKYVVNDIDKFSTEKEKYEEIVSGQKKKVSNEYLVLKADVTINCEKDLQNKTVNVNFSQSFKDINKILVDLKGKQKRKFVIDNSTGSFAL